jgi:hydroxymethylpyrimidine pyrophosphatase-like HAD family hydrolase
MSRNTEKTMTPLAACPRETLAAIEGVLTDIDETVSTHSQLTAEAYGAMEALKKAGFRVIPVTGRPAGWCDLIARFWPVDAVVGENGAFWMWHDDKAKKLRTRFVQSEAERADGRHRLEILRIVRIFEKHGAHAKVSSIHVNGWFGDYDKLTTSRQMMAELIGVDVDSRRDRYVFSGDSPNDAPMFGFFPNAVGVANVNDFAADMDHLPRWITTGRSGAGFVELAEALLAARR